MFKLLAIGSALVATSLAMNPTGPLTAVMAKYPGSTLIQQSIPTGSVTVADGAQGALKMQWDLKNLRPTLKASLGSYPATDRRRSDDAAVTSAADADSVVDDATPPTGTVIVEDQWDGWIKVIYDMAGFEDGSNDSEMQQANRGLHIHTGTSCEDEQLVGGHYWSDSASPDPWRITYTVGADGAAKGSFQLKSGYTFDGNVGHVVVVHNDAGARVACGVLNVANGGVHIHTGTSCADADAVGGHYWTPTSDADPWTTTYASGAASAAGSVTLSSGFQFAGNVNHAVVVHSAADGSRIGCGVLEAAAQTDEAPHVHFDCAKFKTECVDTGKADAYADCAATLAVNTHTTVACRREHLGLITAGDDASQTTHCGHAAEVATGPCASESLVMAFNWLSGFSDPDMQHATVKVNSSIGFYWDGMHNIYELPDKAAYDACDFSKATAILETPVEKGLEIVAFPTLGMRFFACQVGAHCSSGQKLMVHPEELMIHSEDHDGNTPADASSAVIKSVGVGIFAVVATLF